ncbi:hypothetical protein [Vibrio crassostreae]|uniref:hypothetical protein n=1 Tax=Vibrio crassostreae TaxID=246167 RepID=UPI001B30D1CC|nr:hypothetical protein [Vibrio crassostreae]
MVSNIVKSFINASPISIVDMVLVQPDREEFLLPDITYTGSDLINLSVIKGISHHFASIHGNHSKVEVSESEVISMIVHFENKKKPTHQQVVKSCELKKPVYSSEQLKVIELYNKVHSDLADFIISIVRSDELKERLMGVIESNTTIRGLLHYYSVVTHCALGVGDYDQLDKDLNNKYSKQEEMEGSRELSKILTEQYEMLSQK